MWGSGESSRQSPGDASSGGTHMTRHTAGIPAVVLLAVATLLTATAGTATAASPPAAVSPNPSPFATAGCLALDNQPGSLNYLNSEVEPQVAIRSDRSVAPGRCMATGPVVRRRRPRPGRRSLDRRGGPLGGQPATVHRLLPRVRLPGCIPELPAGLRSLGVDRSGRPARITGR